MESVEYKVSSAEYIEWGWVGVVYEGFVEKIVDQALYDSI